MSNLTRTARVLKATAKLRASLALLTPIKGTRFDRAHNELLESLWYFERELLDYQPPATVGKRRRKPRLKNGDLFDGAPRPEQPETQAAPPSQ